jgi:hypothetical protein
MTTNLTFEEVQAQANAQGYYVGEIPGQPGYYALARPPETEALNTVPLTLEGVVQWLRDRKR